MAEPSWQDIYDVFKASAQNARSSLLFEEGDVTDAWGSGTASAALIILARIANRFLANFLDGAVGVDLTALAHDRGVDRDPGASAVGTIKFARVSAAFGGGTIPAGTRIASEPDPVTGLVTTVTTDEDVVFGALDLLKTVTATCDGIGKTGNVAANTLTRAIDPLFDASITAINLERFSGGVEEESDEDLRDRVRGFFLTQARGTIDALEFGARTVPGVDRVSIIVDDSGIVTVYVADEDGNSNTAMATLVAIVLESWRAAGDVVFVSPGVLVNVGITLAVTVRTGVSIGPLLDRIRQAVVSRVGRLNPGETLYRDAIAAAARDVDKEAILGVDVINPPVNITPSMGELLRTTIPGVDFQ